MKNASELREISDSIDSQWVKDQLQEIEVNMTLVANRGGTSFNTGKLLKPQVVNALKENGYTVESRGGRDPRGTDGDAQHYISW